MRLKELPFTIYDLWRLLEYNGVKYDYELSETYKKWFEYKGNKFYVTLGLNADLALAFLKNTFKCIGNESYYKKHSIYSMYYKEANKSQADKFMRVKMDEFRKIRTEFIKFFGRNVYELLLKTKD